MNTISVRFDVLHAYAQKNKLNFNDLCRTVRDAIADGSRAVVETRDKAIEMAYLLEYAAYCHGFEAGKVGQHVDTTIAQQKCKAALGRLLVVLQELMPENERRASTGADTVRLDWLADKDQSYGNVQLPQECVMRNIDSLRAAIDDAMAMHAREKETPNE